MSALVQLRFAGACRDEDPELHFPTSEARHFADQIAMAKAVCHRCPVLAKCQEQAVVNGEPYGIWGGLTETERRDIRDQVALIEQKLTAAASAAAGVDEPADELVDEPAPRPARRRRSRAYASAATQLYRARKRLRTAREVGDDIRAATAQAQVEAALTRVAACKARSTDEPVDEQRVDADQAVA